MELFSQITEWMDKFTIWVAVITLMLTILNWWSAQKGKADIHIVLTYESKRISLAQTIKRRHLTRSEVQGVLANAYCSKKGRYNIPFLASKTFSQRLESVQDGKGDTLIIDLDNLDEFTAFDSE